MHSLVTLFPPLLPRRQLLGQRFSGQFVALGLLRHPGVLRGLLHYEPHPRHLVRVSYSQV